MPEVFTCVSIRTANTGREVILDESDYPLVSGYIWIENIHGYAMSNKRPSLTMHRLIMDSGDKPYLGHINGNKLDNRRRNLRPCTNSENQMNRKITKNKSSKYKGVYFDKNRGRYRAVIVKDKIKYSLGSHKSEDEAANAYNIAAAYHFGEFAKFNVIEEDLADNLGRGNYGLV